MAQPTTDTVTTPPSPSVDEARRLAQRAKAAAARLAEFSQAQIDAIVDAVAAAAAGLFKVNDTVANGGASSFDPHPARSPVTEATASSAPPRLFSDWNTTDAWYCIAPMLFNMLALRRSWAPNNP